jgi:hypothetical protein
MPSSDVTSKIQLSLFGGGHVGYFGDVDGDAAMLQVVTALAGVAPGVGSAAAARQLKQQQRGRVEPSMAGALEVVHFSAQCKHRLWDALSGYRVFL